MNNREIKFRVWSKQYNTSKLMDWVRNNPCPPYIEGNFEAHEKWTKEKLAINESCSFFQMIYPSNFDCDGQTFGWTTRGYLDTGSCGERNNLDLEPDQILMQFTGLKDSNEKEIYEGDIVSVFGAFVSKNGGYIPNTAIGNAIITYDEELMSFFPRVIESKGFTGKSGYLIGRYTVIGNIFENPELLEK